MAVAKNLYRCGNQKCQQSPGGGGFYSEKPTCPKCGLTESGPTAIDKRFGHLVVRMVKIHFDPPHESMPGFGKNTRACSESKPIQVGVDAGGSLNMFHQGTGNAFVVNCPECMSTAAYKAARESFNEESDTETATAMQRIGQAG